MRLLLPINLALSTLYKLVPIAKEEPSMSPEIWSSQMVFLVIQSAQILNMVQVLNVWLLPMLLFRTMVSTQNLTMFRKL